MLHTKNSVFLIVAIALLVLFSGCPQSPPANIGNGTPPNGGSNGTVQPPIKTGPLKGVSISPRSGSAEDFTGFFETAVQGNDIIMWAGDWIQMSDAEKGAPAVTAGLAPIYGYVPLIEAQFFTQATGKLERPLDTANKQAYKESAAAFAEKHKPEYLGFGIEVNVLYDKAPDDFQDYVDFFPRVVDAVKAKSPNTKVFTVFQLEGMKGLMGGLRGEENNSEQAHWFLIEKFPKADVIAFSTYPSFTYKNPSEIPNDFYTEIRQHTSKPIIFTEIGWHSTDSIEGWESSEEEQAEFVKTFFSLTKDLEPKILVWSFLYDPEFFEPFGSMGFYSRETGNAKKAWEEWKNA